MKTPGQAVKLDLAPAYIESSESDRQIGNRENYWVIPLTHRPLRLLRGMTE